jgi:hypothetical protein
MRPQSLDSVAQSMESRGGNVVVVRLMLRYEYSSTGHGICKTE